MYRPAKVNYSESFGTGSREPWNFEIQPESDSSFASLDANLEEFPLAAIPGLIELLQHIYDTYGQIETPKTTACR